MTYSKSIRLMLKEQERMLNQIAPVLKLWIISIPAFRLTDSMRIALDSTQMAKLSNWASLSNGQLQASERLFRLPALMETSQLQTGLSHGTSSYIQRNSEFNHALKAVLDAMTSMKTPWLNLENIQRSYNGFARLQGTWSCPLYHASF